MTEVTRRYYPNALDSVTLPCTLGHGFTLAEPETLPQSMSTQRQPLHTYQFCAHIEGIEERTALLWFQAFEDAIHFHLGTSFHESHTVTSSGREISRKEDCVGWGDNWDTPIGEAAIQFAAQAGPGIKDLMLPETFNRVSNAMRLYDNAQVTQNLDFALLGFIGCLESLFSIAPQELSFRLCLTVSKFSHDTPVEQMLQYSELKKLYTVRSKVAHGDKLSKNEGRSAIQLAEYWLPTAANICRAVIYRILEWSLISAFNNRKEHEQLLEHVLFYSNLEAALVAIHGPNNRFKPTGPPPLRSGGPAA